MLKIMEKLNTQMSDFSRDLLFEYLKDVYTKSANLKGLRFDA